MTNPVAVEELEVNIPPVIEHIPTKKLERVMENLKFRTDHVSHSFDQHLKKIIFKK